MTGHILLGLGAPLWCPLRGTGRSQGGYARPVLWGPAGSSRYVCRVHAAVDIFDCMRGLMVQTCLCFDPMAVERLALLLLPTHTMAKMPPSPHIFPLLSKITTRSPHFGFGNMLRGSVSSYFDPFYNTKLSPAPSFARRTHTTSPIFFIFWYPQFRAHKHVPAD